MSAVAAKHHKKSIVSSKPQSAHPKLAPLEPSAELLAELASKSDESESAKPIEVLEWAVERFGSGLTMGTAFGPEGMTILYMLSTFASCLLWCIENRILFVNMARVGI